MSDQYDPYAGYPMYQGATQTTKPAAPTAKYGELRADQGCPKCRVKGHIRVTKVDTDGVHLLCKLCGKELTVPK